MSQISYEYETPVGATKLPVPSKRALRKLGFPKHHTNWLKGRYDFFEDAEFYYLDVHDSWALVVLSILLLPVTFLIYGVGSWKEVLEDNCAIASKKWVQKRGKFVRSRVRKKFNGE